GGIIEAARVSPAAGYERLDTKTNAVAVAPVALDAADREEEIACDLLCPGRMPDAQQAHRPAAALRQALRLGGQPAFKIELPSAFHHRANMIRRKFRLDELEVTLVADGEENADKQAKNRPLPRRTREAERQRHRQKDQEKQRWAQRTRGKRLPAEQRQGRADQPGGGITRKKRRAAIRRHRRRLRERSEGPVEFPERLSR